MSGPLPRPLPGKHGTFGPCEGRGDTSGVGTQGTPSPRRGGGRGERSARRTAAGHTLIEPPRSWTEGVQLPLIPVAEAPDRVPELTHYRDEGCRFWHACLSCPFPRCVFEEPGGPRRAAKARRNEEIRRLYIDGEPVDAIAARFGIVRRSVYRAIGGIRGGRGAEVEGRRAALNVALDSRPSTPAGRREERHD